MNEELPREKVEGLESVDVGQNDAIARARAGDTVLDVRPDEPAAVANASQVRKNAGAVLVQALGDDPEIVPLVLDAIKSALGANQMYYDKYAKKWGAEPDGRTRLAGATLALQYLVGLPLQRIQSHTINTPGDARSLATVAKNSPAMFEAMARVVDGIRAQGKKAA